MVKLPDPTALGAAPGFARGGSAQVNSGLLDSAQNAILRGGMSVAQSYQNSGNAIANSMGSASAALAAAAAGPAQVGRAVGQTGAEAGQAVAASGAQLGQATARAGAELSNAVSRGGSMMGSTLAGSGADLGQAVARGGAQTANSLNNSGQMMGNAITQGGAVVANAMRNVGNYWSEATQKAGQYQAQGTRDLATGMQSMANAAIEYQHTQDALQFDQAKSAFLIEKSNLDQKYQHDQDFPTMSDRYSQDLGSLRSSMGDLVTNPAMRKRFDLETQLTTATGINNIKERAFSVQKDANVAQLSSTLDDLQQSAMTAPDEKARGDYLITGRRYIDNAEKAGYLSATEAEKARTGWAEKYSIAWVQALPPEARIQMLQGRPEGRDATINRIVQIEGTGKNPRSSAVGVGQFTDGTWLSTVQQARPDLMDGRTQAQVLALKNDPAIAKEMVGHLYDINSQYLRDNGLVDTPANIYLAHFLGPQGAVKVLNAPAGTPLSDVLGNSSIKANPSIMAGKTVDDLLAWSEQKMGGSVRGTGTPIDYIGPPKLAVLEKQAQTDLLKQQTDQAKSVEEGFDRRIIDFKSGVGTDPLFSRDEITANPYLTKFPEKQNKLLTSYDAAVKSGSDLQTAKSIFFTPGATFNRFDKDHQDGADELSKRLTQAGQPPLVTMENFADKGILTKTNFVGIRGAVESSDPTKVQQGLQLASRLKARDPNIFDGQDGGTGIDKAATDFSTYVERQGKTAEEATALIMRANTPEGKKEIALRLKDDTAEAKLKASATEDDIVGHFSQKFLGIRTNAPAAGLTEEQKRGMVSDYRDMVRDEYLNGNAPDMATAKERALNNLNKRWGVSSVTGKGVVTLMPPEQATAYQGIDHVSDRIATQAVAKIKAETGQDVDRSKIMLTPILNGVTTKDWNSQNGTPPQYQLSYWDDKAGHWNTVNSAFRADPKAMRADMSASAITTKQRQDSLTLSSQDAGIDPRAPFGVQ